jgi:fatty-acyl-CoA synthase
MCSGYFNDPDVTAAMLDAEGWFHTGDMVYHDEEWYFYVVDRKKDMFISGGENVYPNEIEAALYRHPAVRLCAVIGVPNARGRSGWRWSRLTQLLLRTRFSRLKDNLARYSPQTGAIHGQPTLSSGKIKL